MPSLNLGNEADDEAAEAQLSRARRARRTPTNSPCAPHLSLPAAAAVPAAAAATACPGAGGGAAACPGAAGLGAGAAGLLLLSLRSVWSGSFCCATLPADTSLVAQAGAWDEHRSRIQCVPALNLFCLLLIPNPGADPRVFAAVAAAVLRLLAGTSFQGAGHPRAAGRLPALPCG